MNKNADKFGLKLSLLVVAATLLVLLWSISYTGKTTTQENMIMPDGKLKILGITLDENNLRESEILLKSRSDTALYIYPSEHAQPGRRIEAFFPAIADHSKVILSLGADEIMLNAIEKRATLPRLYPDGVARRNLAAEDLTLVQKLAVKALTLVPSVKIDEATLTARFGQPAFKEVDRDGTMQMRFPASGLNATINSEGSAMLHFQNPDQPN